ncbi:class F sortase [Cohnella sp. NL03-T5]|nr:class F sortase [Cohnella silvisoli]
MYILLVVLLVICTNCSQSNKSRNDRGSEYKKSESNLTYPKKATTKTIEPRSTKKIQLTDGIVPARLYIPLIDLHATVEPVGVANNGQMGIPRSTERVGYLSNGVLPGSVGNAVMDGHVDNYKGPAVFFRLRKLGKGDKVIVKNEKGYAITFIVDSIGVYKTSEAPIDKIFGPANEPRLNLITCTGKYSRKKREHEARLVIFTKRLMDDRTAFEHGLQAVP